MGGTRITTNVYFSNCINRVWPSFQWTNAQGNVGVLLHDESNAFIEIPSYSWVVSEPDGQTFIDVTVSARNANRDFDNFFLSGQSKNIRSYTIFELRYFGDLSNYPAGTYRSSLIFSAHEY